MHRLTTVNSRLSNLFADGNFSLVLKAVPLDIRESFGSVVASRRGYGMSTDDESRGVVVEVPIVICLMTTVLKTLASRINSKLL